LPSIYSAPDGSKEAEVLEKLRRVIDPDFGEDIVNCGFVKALEVDESAGRVLFAIELTTPACPVKAEFERQAKAFGAAGEKRRARDGGGIETGETHHRGEFV
jgi:metal-sulfur cluster biosynthetic enzyme